MSEIKGDPQEILERLTQPYFEQGVEKVYVAKCCGGVFVGVVPPVGCRACGREPPAFVAFASQEDVDASKIPPQTPP